MSVNHNCKALPWQLSQQGDRFSLLGYYECFSERYTVQYFTGRFSQIHRGYGFKLAR
jgi:hypothetical protein